MELFDILDDMGKPIGQATRAECHNRSFILHGVVHALVFNSSGCLLLQKRSLSKDIQPGKWDTSVGGHINTGESIEDAIHREAAEELCINGVEFEKMYSYIMTSDVEREFVTTFRCLWDKPVTHLEGEIDEVRFFSNDEIESLHGTGFFTPNFEEEWRYYMDWKKCREKKKLNRNSS